MNEAIRNWGPVLLGAGILAACVLVAYLAASVLLALLSLQRLMRGPTEPDAECRQVAPAVRKAPLFVPLFSLVFLLGVGTCVTVGEFWRGRDSRVADETARRARLLSKLQRELGLSPNQVRLIAPTVTAMSKRLARLHDERATAIVRVFEHYDSVIAGDLTLEQERHLKAMDARRWELCTEGERVSRLEAF